MTEKDFSQYDLGGVLRSAHEDKNQALRITSANTSVPPKYSRVELTYNTNNSVTNAKFFSGTLAEERHIEFFSDVGGSLNNTYFTLQSENDESLYHIWYNVAGAGVDPSPSPLSKSIEIELQVNDPAQIVTLATRLALNKIEDFKVNELAPTKLNIINQRKGVCTNTTNGGTGFNIVTVQQGEEELIKSVDVPYDGITRYLFNNQEKRFELATSDINFAAIETELLDQGLSLDSIDTNISNIDTNINALTKAEDSAHVSGDSGIMPLAVRADSEGSLADADGDYAPLQVDSQGKLKVAADVIILNKLIDIPHDDIEVVQFTADGDPEIVEVREGNTLKRTLTLFYNADGEFQRVLRT